MTKGTATFGDSNVSAVWSQGVASHKKFQSSLSIISIRCCKSPNGSPGLLVIGGGSCSEGCGSNPGAVYWMDMIFFTLICCKNCNDVCFKRLKESGVGPLKY